MWLKRAIARFLTVYPMNLAANRCLSTKVPIERKINLDGVSINVAHSDFETSKPYLLCLPGALGSWRTDFSPQVQALRQDFNVIAWDPPGYGNSRPPDRTFEGEFFAHDAKLVDSLMQSQKWVPYSVLGWSDGAITGLLLAHNHGEDVNRLVLWGGNAFIDSDDLAMYNSIRDIDKWSERMRQPMVDVYGYEYFKSTWNAWVDAFEKLFRENNGNICREILPHIAHKSLIVHGMKDPVVPYHHAEYLKENLRNASLVTHSDGKHNLHLRYHEWFNELVTDFLKLT